MNTHILALEILFTHVLLWNLKKDVASTDVLDDRIKVEKLSLKISGDLKHSFTNAYLLRLCTKNLTCCWSGL